MRPQKFTKYDSDDFTLTKGRKTSKIKSAYTIKTLRSIVVSEAAAAVKAGGAMFSQLSWAI